MATSASKTTTTKAWEEIRLTTKAMSRVVVDVGIVGAAASQPHNGGPATNAEIGAIHEYGDPSNNLPERSWLRQTFKLRHAEIVRLYTAAIRGLLSRKVTIDRALSLVGLTVSGWCRETILHYGGLIFQPLKPRTIAEKIRHGAPNPAMPLVDTGQLANAVGYLLRHA